MWGLNSGLILLGFVEFLVGAEVIVVSSGALAALKEEPGSVHRTHPITHNCNSRFRGSDMVF